jgi:hypothetical protein
MPSRTFLYVIKIDHLFLEQATYLGQTERNTEHWTHANLQFKISQSKFCVFARVGSRKITTLYTSQTSLYNTALKAAVTNSSWRSMSHINFAGDNL